MAQAHLNPQTADYDDAMMRILVNLEALQKLAAEAGDDSLAAQLKTAFEDNLQRYYDIKRAQLEAAIDRAESATSRRRA